MAATLSARVRAEHGKGAARALRRQGLIPANVYGRGDASQSLAVDALELSKLLSSISVENTLIDLRVEGAQPTRALIREVQRHPSRPLLLHLDLQLVHAGERLILDVPVRLDGIPVGVRDDGGALQQTLYELSVECLPADIPEVVEIDISGMRIGDAVHVRDITLANAKVLNDADLAICAVAAPTAAALPETAVAEGTVGGDVEPDLVRSRPVEDAEG